MHFAVLGPLDVSHAGHQVAVRRPRQRAVLGYLLLSANHLVATNALIEAIWGGAPPSSARAQIHADVSALRRSLREAGAADPIATFSTGYRIGLPAADVDLSQFADGRTAAREAMRAGDRTRAWELLRGALSLWRGPALADVQGSYVEAARTALADDRLSAYEQLAEIGLGLGREQELVSELSPLVQLHPAREQLTGHLMVALYRCGRQADALRLGRELRRHLARQLGLDPAPPVQLVEQQILHNSPELLRVTSADSIVASAPPAAGGNAWPGPPVAGRHAPGVTPAASAGMLPPDIPDFTGRATEVVLLRDMLTRPRGDAAPVIAVAGPGGIGKTALCVHVAHHLHEQYPDGQLFADMRGIDEHTASSPSEVLGRFLRALGIDGAAVPASVDERVDLYRRLLADRRVIVVLDNARSDDQVLPLIPGSPACAVLMNARTRLGVTMGAHAMNLEVFAPGDAADLLLRISGRAGLTAGEPVVADLCRQCGHLPLALRVAGAKLAAKPHWRAEKLARLLRDERGRLDQLSHGHLDVRASIMLSYAGLAAATKQMLRRLGDLDLPEVTAWAAAALQDCATEDAEAQLEHLVDAQLLAVADAGATGQLRYRLHDLVRLFARQLAVGQEAPEQLRSARDRVYGAWLAVADAVCHATGADFLNIRGSAPRRAVDDSTLCSLAAQPQDWLESELSAITALVARARQDGRSDAAWNLVCALTPLYEMRRCFDDLHRALQVALAAAEESGDQGGRAAMLNVLGCVMFNWMRYAEVEGIQLQAIALFAGIGDKHGEAVARAFWATFKRCSQSGNDDSAFRTYQQVLPVFHAAGDRGSAAFALRCIGQLHAKKGRLAEADECYEQALRSYRECDSAQGQAQTLLWQGMLRIAQDRPEEAERNVASALAMARGFGDRAGEAMCLSGLARCQLAKGNRHAAKATFYQALNVARQTRRTHIEVLVAGQINDLCGSDAGRARPVIRAQPARAEALSTSRWQEPE